jgi:aerobic carbon-monoxide dehydrogenase large subunit
VKSIAEYFERSIGWGEAGTIGAPGAIMNAVVDALAPLGIVDIDMPATSERVWRAMASGGKHHDVLRLGQAPSRF